MVDVKRIQQRIIEAKQTIEIVRKHKDKLKNAGAIEAVAKQLEKVIATGEAHLQGKQQELVEAQDAFRRKEKLLVDIEEKIKALLKEVTDEREFFARLKKLETIKIRDMKDMDHIFNIILDNENFFRELLEQKARISSADVDAIQEKNREIRNALQSKKVLIRSAFEDIKKNLGTEKRIERRENRHIKRLLNKDRKVVQVAEEAQAIVQRIEAARADHPELIDKEVSTAVDITAATLQQFFQDHTKEGSAYNDLVKYLTEQQDFDKIATKIVAAILKDDALFADEAAFMHPTTGITARRRELEKAIHGIYSIEPGIVRALDECSSKLDTIHKHLVQLDEKLQELLKEVKYEGSLIDQARRGRTKAWRGAKALPGRALDKLKGILGR